MYLQLYIDDLVTAHKEAVKMAKISTALNVHVSFLIRQSSKIDVILKQLGMAQCRGVSTSI